MSRVKEVGVSKTLETENKGAHIPTISFESCFRKSYQVNLASEIFKGLGIKFYTMDANIQEMHINIVLAYFGLICEPVYWSHQMALFDVCKKNVSGLYFWIFGKIRYR